MQTSTSFKESRGVRVLRWVARGLAVVVAMGMFLWMSISIGPEAPGVPPAVIEPAMWARWGVLGAGLALALLGSFFWKGIGEVVGGLLLVVGGVWQGFTYVPLQTGVLAGGAVFVVPGVLFIICGWYTLAQRSHHGTPLAA